MDLAARLNLSLTGEQTNPLDLGTGSFQFAASLIKNLTSGTGADQADVLFTDERSLATGANEDLDVAAALAGAFGVAAVFAKLKGILILCSTANTTRLTISRPASNGVPMFAAASDALAGLAAGGVFLLWDPSAAGFAAVTAGTGDLINIANASGATATYKVVLIGTSV